MGRYRSKKHRRRKALKFISFTLAIIAVTIACFVSCDEIREYFNEGNTTAPVTEGNVEFHFIDCGQGDAAIIRTSQGIVLIDTSTGSFETKLKAYLDYQGIKTIDYAVFTHPDEDHIGGADMIMKEYDVKHVVLSGFTKTTKTFQNMMNAIEASNAEVTIPEPGWKFTLGELTMEVLAPLDDYDDANEASVVFRADYGKTSVLFTGDAEKESEADMIKRYGLSDKLDCDLLKVGHHGSHTSSTADFIEAVSPDFAVISCGAGNEYGHPHQKTVVRLQNAGIDLNRTDKEGTIVFISDGETLQKKTD